MKIHVWTQDSENYGTVEAPYWKMKGGEDFFVPLTVDAELSEFALKHLIKTLRDQIEVDSVDFRRFISGYDVVADDYLTDFEQSQMEFEGKITYATKIINIA